MHNNFLAAVFLASSALAAPAPAESTTSTVCTARSGAVKEWTVRDFAFRASYIFTTPAHQNSWGYVDFELENAAVDYKPRCSAQSSQLQDFFYGTQVYNCEIPQDIGDAASFTFSRPSGDLRINQTWNCVYEGSRFEARGGVHLDLDCEDKTWQNSNWQPGQIYSTRDISCKHVTTKAPMEERTGVA